MEEKENEFKLDADTYHTLYDSPFDRWLRKPYDYTAEPQTSCKYCDDGLFKGEEVVHYDGEYFCDRYCLAYKLIAEIGYDEIELNLHNE